MHLPAYQRACRHVELLAELDPHSGGLLHDDELVGIVDGVPHLIDGALLIEGPDRAMNDALPAVDADTVAKTSVKGRCDDRIETPVIDGEGIHRLNPAANLYATSAEYALVGVADNGDAGAVDGKPLSGCVPVIKNIDAKRGGKLLELTVVVLHARQAIGIMIRQDKLDELPARRHDPRRMGLHLEPLGRGGHAGPFQARYALYLDNADPALSSRREIGMVAKRGDRKSRLLRRPQDGRTFRYLHGYIVHCQFYHAHVISP
ncbi:MAG: hypothetical protein A4E61_00284 [Syntrophorhabdus sp. PtaB.Bin184]|nr:MAG: hypothetical protein A4E61_00284 [Syntrophorhabdus sp. PtaB.Bin184]